MSFVYDPAVPEDDASNLGKFAAATNVNYDRRALQFTIWTVIISLISIPVVFTMPLAFLFAFFGARNTQQAKNAGYVLQRPQWINVFHYLPIAMLALFTVYFIYALGQPQGGWAWLGLLIIALTSIPALIVSLVVGFYTTRRLRAKDGLSAGEEPRNTLISTYRILGYFSLLIPVLGLSMGFGMGF